MFRTPSISREEEPNDDALRTVVSFNASDSYPKRCVTCFNPVGDNAWPWGAVRDEAWLNEVELNKLGVPATWRAEGGRRAAASGRRCGMMWTGHAAAHNLSDYVTCTEQNAVELLDRGQRPALPRGGPQVRDGSKGEIFPT